MFGGRQGRNRRSFRTFRNYRMALITFGVASLSCTAVAASRSQVQPASATWTSTHIAASPTPGSSGGNCRPSAQLITPSSLESPNGRSASCERQEDEGSNSVGRVGADGVQEPRGARSRASGARYRHHEGRYASPMQCGAQGARCVVERGQSGKIRSLEAGTLRVLRGNGPLSPRSLTYETGSRAHRAARAS